MDVSVIGLGKLGSVIAGLYGANGHRVIGVDLDKDVVNKINSGVAPFFEPNLQELIFQAKKNLVATDNLENAILNTDLTFTIVPTPSDKHGIFSNEYLIKVLSGIGECLRQKNRFHTIVINSTVMPVSCDNEFIPLLEKISNKKVNSDFGLVYSPEFIALGNIVQDMMNPDIVLIGESNEKSGKIVEALSKTVIKSNPEIHHMNLVNAEVVKIAINTFVTSKISFANMLSEICEKLPNSDVNVVTNAVGSDSRIGKKYLKAGLGYGGPCFPRDNIALSKLAENLGISSEIPRATDKINKNQITRALALLENFSNKTKIGILGLSYKPDTPVVEESQGIMIANLLAKNGKEVVVHDPHSLSEADSELDQNIDRVHDLESVLGFSEVVIICTPWKIYSAILESQLKGKIVIDYWRVLENNNYENFDLIYPGKYIRRI